MNLTDILETSGVTILVGAGVAVLVGNIYYVLRSKTSKIQREQISQLKEDFSHCEAKHVESQKAIHKLEGQVEVLRELPLANISTDIKSIAITNGKILDRLNDTAVIEAKTRKKK